MIKVITGQNAVGKTLYLNKMFEDLLADNKKVSYNLDKSMRYRKYDYSSSAIERLSSNLQLVDIDENGNIKELVKNLSVSFISQIKMLLLDVEYILLDEPEMGLSSVENDNLIAALWSIRDIREIVIVSHNSDYCNLDKLYNVSGNGLSEITYENINCI
jgi:ABC-type branched-subunit amino acid transport system ATPase component